MAVIDPYAGGPEQFNEDMWKEFVGSWRAGGESVFNKRSGEAVLSGHIPATALKAAMRFCLGYEQVRPVGPDNPGTEKFTPKVTLCRRNPIRHPYYENLWCTGIGEHEFKPVSEYVPGVGAKLKVPTKPVPVKTPPPLQNRAGYARAKLTLKFSPLAHDLLEDDDSEYTPSKFASEWLRNVTVDTEPRVSTIEVQEPYYFCEGTGLPAPYSNAKGRKAIAPRARLLVQPDVVFRWHDVPAAWIMSPGTQLPTNLLAALGSLNSGLYANTFLGFPVGTLFLTGVKLTKYPWTLRPAAAVPNAGLESKFLYEVELLCSFFDPEKGFAGNPPKRIEGFRGWNNAMYPGVPTTPEAALLGAAKDPAANTWYYISASGTIDDTGFFKYTPFENCFNSPQNVTTAPAVAG